MSNNKSKFGKSVLFHHDLGVSLMTKIVKKANVREFSAVFSAYTIFSILFTLPLIFNLNSSIFGFTSDNFPTVWSFWATRNSLSNTVIDLVRYPLGETLVGQLELGWSVPFSLISPYLGELVTFNLFTIIGFIFAGVMMFYLAKYFTNDNKISFLIGMIYTFAPFHFWQGFVHMSLGFLYTLPAYFLVLFIFDTKRTIKWGVLLGVAFVITFLTSLYFGFFTLLATFSYFGVKLLVSTFQKKNYLSKSLVISLISSIVTAGVLISPILYSFFIRNNLFQAIGGLPKRPINDLLSLSMRPWDFILPAPNHPFWGKTANHLLEIIQSKSNDFKTVSAFLPERINYVGITTLIAAAVGLVFIFIRKQKRELSIVLILLIITLILLSSPPFIIVHGITIKFPTYFIYPVLTFYRVYARMGVLALMLLLLLTGIGLEVALKKARFKNLLLITIGILVFIEFLPFGWNQSTNLKSQPVYNWLKNQPEKVIVEYPTGFDLADGVIWQMYHGKKIYNDFYGQEILPIKTELGNLYDPETWQKLKAVGVDLVVFHTKYLYEEPHPINNFYVNSFADAPFSESSAEAQVVASFDNAIVYKPTTKNAKMVYVDGKNKSYTWLYDSDWEWDTPENSIYAYNSTGNDLKVKISYDVKGKIIELKLNNQLFVQSSDIFLKKGLNTLVIKRDRSTPTLRISNFNLLSED